MKEERKVGKMSQEGRRKDEGGGWTDARKEKVKEARMKGQDERVEKVIAGAVKYKAGRVETRKSNKKVEEETMKEKETRRKTKVKETAGE